MKKILDNITNPPLWGWMLITVIVTKHIGYYLNWW